MLQVSDNNLTGNFPSCLFNQSKIYLISVFGNQLEGNLPTDIGITLPSLQETYLGSNNFSGLIPISFSNATRLEVISLSRNYFTGSIPSDLGRLQGLQSLFLHSNQLGIEAGDDLEFITSLTNCSNLEIISLGQNFLNGSFPGSVANLSTTLRFLWAGENHIHGSIPLGIENLVNLEGIYFDSDYLTGNIPAAIGKLKNLQELHLEGNMLSGQIPFSLGNLTQLTILVLESNKLSGVIPQSLERCRNMQVLSLSYNQITGTIPEQFASSFSLMLELSLHQNKLSGSLPSQVGNLTNLLNMVVSHNKLSGNIPETLGNCLSLEQLLLDDNLLEGDIPNSLSTLRGLQYLDLSQNNLSGKIPKYMENFPLLYLNLSVNQFEGQVPNAGVFVNTSAVSINGNKNLCGGISDFQLPSCKQDSRDTKKKSSSVRLVIVLAVVLGSLSLVFVACVFLLLYRRRTRKRMPSSTTSFSDTYKRVSYAELLTATNGFSADNLIGTGSYGTVFKGFLQKINKTVAVKVLNLQRDGAIKSFLTECKALRNLRHRNLLKILTACSSVDFQGNDFKALVFEFIPNGSLEEWLHPRTDGQMLQSRNLNFLQKLNIAIDVASALDYLHHQCQPRIIHCDLKPTNILLAEDMTARVADFGIAKIFSTTLHNSVQNLTHSIAIKGSIGYVAPEYGPSIEVSTQGDVYSYGILLLEMFTGKKPTDEMFLNGTSLHNYAATGLSNQVMDIVHPVVLPEENERIRDTERQNSGQTRLKECIISAIRLGRVFC